MVELIEDRAGPQGLWTQAGGTVHHLTFPNGTADNQIALNGRLEGMGHADVSAQPDRTCFKSVDMWSPGGGAHPEPARTVPEGRITDKPPDAIGKSPVFPPRFENRQAGPEAGLRPVAL